MIPSQLVRADTFIFVVWCTAEVCSGVLSRAAAAGLVGPRYAWIITDNPVFDNVGAVVFDGVISVTPSQIGMSAASAARYTYLLGIWASAFPSTYPASGPTVFSGYMFDAVRVVQLGAFAAVAHGWRPGTLAPANATCFGDFHNRSLPMSWLRGVVALGTTGLISFEAASNGPTSATVDLASFGASGNDNYTFSRFASFGTTALQLSPARPSLIWPSGSVRPPSDRSSLAGRVISTATLLSAPFVFVGQDGALTGYTIELARALEPLLGVTFAFHVISNRTYNEITKLVAAGSYDCLFADTTITAARSMASGCRSTRTCGLCLIVHFCCMQCARV